MAKPSRRRRHSLATPTRKPAARRARSAERSGRPAVAAEQLEGRRLMAAGPALQWLNAATDRVVADLTSGMTVDLNGVGSKLSVKANPAAGAAGSMVFKLDGRVVGRENHAPFTILGEDGSDVRAWTPAAGAHTLKVSQFAGGNGTGKLVGTTTASFTVKAATRTVPADPVIGTGGPALTLFNADTDKAIKSLSGAETVRLSEAGSHLSVVATPAGGVGSIVFRLDGRTVSTEGYAPFAMAADDGGDLRSWTPPAGTHTVEAIQYSRPGGRGAIVGRTSVTLTVFAGGGTGGGTTTPPPVDNPGPVDNNPLPPVTGGSNGGAPQAVIGVIGSSGVAGHPVVVHATSSRLPNSPLEARYQWDFGDPSADYNRLTGWSAGHIYDRPGTYTVRLTVTDANGKSDTAATTIRVAGDSRRTVYVDAAGGSDGNPGTAGAPIRSFARASQFARGGNVAVLFRRGQSWNVSGVMSIVRDHVRVGAYGSGPNPVLNLVSGMSAVQTFGGSNSTLIENLTFDTPNKPRGNFAPKMGKVAIATGGTGVAVRNCTFLNLDDGVNANTKPRGLIVQGCSAPSATGIRGYLIWAEGSDVVALGNSAANSTREHIMRISGATRILVAYNDFTNANRGGVDRQDFSKGCIEMQKGSWAYVYGNVTHGGPLRAGPLGKHLEARNTHTDWVVFDNNKAYGHQLDVFPGISHLMIRNNVFYNDNGAAIALNPRDNEGRTMTDVRIVGNTGYNGAAGGQFLHTTAGLLARSVTLVGNTYVARNLVSGVRGAAPVYVAEGNLNGFALIVNNVWPLPREIIKYAQGGVMWVGATYRGQAGFKDVAEWNAYAVVKGDVFKRM